MDTTVINDMYVDLETMRITVYAQSRILNNIVSPPQVDPGECAETLIGDVVCHHPNAVYLNGTGEELTSADGTGDWWVKHSWILGGEGYENCPLQPQETYGNCFWVEGELQPDGISMKIGGVEPEFDDLFNIRQPLVDRSPVEYEVASYESADVDAAQAFVLTFQCEEAVSAFDGSDRTCQES